MDGKEGVCEGCGRSAFHGPWHQETPDGRLYCSDCAVPCECFDSLFKAVEGGDTTDLAQAVADGTLHIGEESEDARLH